MGKPHGFDGSFYVEGASHALPEGTEVELGARRARVERRGGMDSRPLVRLTGLDAREAVAALRGKRLLVAEELADDEWLAEDLVGCEVKGLGTVRRVMEAPTCALLEVEDGTLVPFVGDAIRSVDAQARVIEVDRDFLAALGGGEG